MVQTSSEMLAIGMHYIKRNKLLAELGMGNKLKQYLIMLPRTGLNHFMAGDLT